MAKLIIFDDVVRGVDLPDRAVVVGRSLRVDIPIRDRLLSRKHCTLVPEGQGYRFLDLKSANGSYVNGLRVDKADLECDDVIEIGNTVLVLLETDTWNRGEGLARLRNPVKAQELIQRIKRRAQRETDDRGNGSPIAMEDLSAGVSGPSDADFLQWTRDHFHDLPPLPELFEGFLTHKIACLLVRRLPELRECLSEAMERVLAPESFQGGFEHFRSLVRKEIQASLEEMGGIDSLYQRVAANAAVDSDDGHDPVPPEIRPPDMRPTEIGASGIEPPDPTPRADSDQAEGAFPPLVPPHRGGREASEPVQRAAATVRSPESVPPPVRPSESRPPTEGPT